MTSNDSSLQRPRWPVTCAAWLAWRWSTRLAAELPWRAWARRFVDDMGRQASAPSPDPYPPPPSPQSCADWNHAALKLHPAAVR